MDTAIEGFQGAYRFLSNFYVGVNHIEVNGYKFLTAEHVYQALKASTVQDVMAIQACKTPGDAKRLGKTIQIRPDWDMVKDRAMEITVWRKFLSDPYLMQQLLDTGNSKLVESNTWHDNYWGACTCSKCSGLPKLNKLGEQLMIVRDVIQETTGIDI